MVGVVFLWSESRGTTAKRQSDTFAFCSLCCMKYFCTDKELNNTPQTHLFPPGCLQHPEVGNVTFLLTVMDFAVVVLQLEKNQTTLHYMPLIHLI